MKELQKSQRRDRETSTRDEKDKNRKCERAEENDVRRTESRKQVSKKKHTKRANRKETMQLGGNIYRGEKRVANVKKEQMKRNREIEK